MRETRNGNSRAGATLLETLMAAVIALTVLVGISQHMTMTAIQKRLMSQRAIAAREASNALELLMSRPWNELPGEEPERLDVKEEIKAPLPGVSIVAGSTAVGEQSPARIEARAISVSVEWGPMSGKAAQRVQLTAWRFRGEAGE